MKLQTRHFGEIEIDENKQIVFTEGLPGFEDLKAFILLEDIDSPFCYLQSLDQGDITFTIIDPLRVKKDYAPYIHENYFDKLGGGNTSEFIMYSIVTLREPIEETTVNLQAPLLIHTDRRVGVQAIVEDKSYKVRHKLVELIGERGQDYASTNA